MKKIFAPFLGALEWLARLQYRAFRTAFPCFSERALRWVMAVVMVTLMAIALLACPSRAAAQERDGTVGGNTATTIHTPAPTEEPAKER